MRKIVMLLMLLLLVSSCSGVYVSGYSETYYRPVRVYTPNYYPTYYPIRPVRVYTPTYYYRPVYRSNYLPRRR